VQVKPTQGQSSRSTEKVKVRDEGHVVSISPVSASLCEAACAQWAWISKNTKIVIEENCFIGDENWIGFD